MTWIFLSAFSLLGRTGVEAGGGFTYAARPSDHNFVTDAAAPAAQLGADAEWQHAPFRFGLGVGVSWWNTEWLQSFAVASSPTVDLTLTPRWESCTGFCFHVAAPLGVSYFVPSEALEKVFRIRGTPGVHIGALAGASRTLSENLTFVLDVGVMARWFHLGSDAIATAPDGRMFPHTGPLLADTGEALTFKSHTVQVLLRAGVRFALADL
jgi:hypothetical protein